MDKYSELVEKKLVLEEKAKKIKLQIDEARYEYLSTGVMSDTKWFNKARYALDMTKMELKRVNAEYEKCKREMKKERVESNKQKSMTYDRAFIDVCKEVLSSAQFSQIAYKAKLKMDKKDEVVSKHDKSINKSWSRDEEIFLLENYKNYTMEELALYMNKSVNAVKSKLIVLKKKGVSI